MSEIHVATRIDNIKLRARRLEFVAPIFRLSQFQTIRPLGMPNNTPIFEQAYLRKLMTASYRNKVSNHDTMAVHRRLTLLFEPYASLCPLASQHKQCSSSSSGSELVLGLAQPWCGGRLQLALGVVDCPTFQIRTWLDVAPAMKAPSGVNASRTMGESIVKKHLALLSGRRAFHIRIAQSSPPVAMRRSSSTFGWEGGRGCHAMVVMAPW